MQPLDHKQLLPNKGNVWREPKTLEYLELVIADALMHGAKWSSAASIDSPSGIKITIGKIKSLRVIAPIRPALTYTRGYYFTSGIEKTRDKTGAVTWYIHTVNHNEMVNYINKWGIPKE